MKFLLVEDHALVRQGLRLLLEQMFSDAEVLEAGTAEAGLALASGHAPDCILLDLILPDASGVEHVRRYVEACPNSLVAVLSGVAEAEHVSAVMAAGARGYVPKSQDPQTLEHIIRLLIAGGEYFPPHRPTQSDEAGHRMPDSLPLGDEPNEATGSDFVATLTARQRAVVQLVAEGCTNKEIARRLDILEGTVKVHVRAAMDKLGVSNRTQLAIAATRLGIVDRPE